MPKTRQAPPPQIDPFDEDSIRDSLPLYQRRIEEMESVVKSRENDLKAARTELDRTRERFATLRLWAGYGSISDAGNGDGALSTQQEVINIIVQARRPMRAREVMIAMASDDPEVKTVRWSLWNAAQRGFIQSLGKGLYAPLSWEEPVQQKLKD